MANDTPPERGRGNRLRSDVAGADDFRIRQRVGRLIASLGVAAVLLVAGGCGDGDGATSNTGEGGHLVTQFFAIFNDGPTDNFHPCLDLNPPFELWDITFIAFVHTYKKGNLYVADYENARGPGVLPTPGDTDKDRIRQLRDAALKKNPDMKFIISLGWGLDSNDFVNGAKNPTEFASSVGAIVEENALDGFDVDFESVTGLTLASFRAVSEALRKELDTRGHSMGKRLYLTITPGELANIKPKEPIKPAEFNKNYDYVQIQSYDSEFDSKFPPSKVVGQGVDAAKILFGRDYEAGDTLTSERYDESPDVIAYIKEKHLAGLMGWRVNAGNQMTAPFFSGVKLLGEAFREE